MKLIVCESYPGEISDGKPEDVSRSLSKAISGVKAAVRSSLPSLPKDGEVVALRELADLMAERWADHIKGAQRAIDREIRGK